VRRLPVAIRGGKRGIQPVVAGGRERGDSSGVRPVGELSFDQNSCQFGTVQEKFDGGQSPLCSALGRSVTGHKGRYVRGKGMP